MSEQELIEKIKEKDASAFREIVSLYQKNIVKTCLALVHDTHDAEDLAQEVFIELLDGVKKFRGDSKLSTWLYRVAVNKSLNHISKNKKSFFIQRIESLWNTSSEKTTPKAAIVEDETILEQKEHRNVLGNALNSLPKNQRIAFTLHKYDDLTYKEISGVMDISLSSVESLIFRARQNLQKKLNTYYISRF